MDYIPTNAAHWHLVLNHLPVVGGVVVLLLLGWSAIRNSDDLKRTALGASVLLALVAIPAFLTGEPSEHQVEGLAGVSDRLISEHEEMAEIALWVAVAGGVAALAALVYFRRSRSIPRWVVLSLLGLNLAACLVMARTANLGGKIHHPEIQTYPSPEALPTDPER
jgi:hypothetical protein